MGTLCKALIAAIIFLVCLCVIYCYNREAIRLIWNRFRLSWRKKGKGLGPWIAAIIGFLALIYLLNLVNLLQKISGSINIEYHPEEANNITPVFTYTTTIYMTLVTTLLALMAVSVTAYIFLVGALTSREPYEYGRVRQLKADNTGQLVILAIFSGVLTAINLLLDNGYCSFKWIKYGTILLSFLVICFHIYFIYEIIVYEHCIVDRAFTYVKKNIDHYTSEETDWTRISNTNEEPNELISFIKNMGDLELLMNSIATNHEAEFHLRQNQVKENFLRDIFKNKGMDNAADFIEDYGRMLEIRNCIWIINRDRLYPSNLSYLGEQTYQLLKQLREKGMRAEHFNGMIFNKMNLRTALLHNTSFTDSAFYRVNLNGANLEGADFSRALLNNVDFHNVNATGAVFRDARIVNATFNVDSDFSYAALDGIDLSGQKLGKRRSVLSDNDRRKQHKNRTGKEPSEEFDLYRINFFGAGLKRASFIDGELINITFKNAVLTNAQMTHSSLQGCVFSNADLSEAQMSEIIISQDCLFDYANMEGVNASHSKWGDEDSVYSQKSTIPQKVELLSMNRSRLARANFSQSSFSNCDMNNSYANDSSFIYTTFTNCSFKNTILINADFTDAKIKKCCFQEANLSNILMIMTDSDREVIKTDFSKANFTNAEIRNCIFKGCFFIDTLFSDTLIRDVKFEGCTFLHTQFRDCFFFNVSKDGSLTKENVVFERCEYGTEADLVFACRDWREV